VTLTASTMPRRLFDGPPDLLVETTMVLADRLRGRAPRISAWSSCSNSYAEPRVILISSAVRSPSAEAELFFDERDDRFVQFVAPDPH